MPFLPRKRVVEELERYAEEKPLFTKREVKRLTKKRTGEFRARPGKKNISTWEFRKSVTHAAETRKIHQVDTSRLFRQWRKWVDFPKRPQREGVRQETPETQSRVGMLEQGVQRPEAASLPRSPLAQEPRPSHSVSGRPLESTFAEEHRFAQSEAKEGEGYGASRLQALRQERFEASKGEDLQGEGVAPLKPRFFSRMADRFSGSRELPMRKTNDSEDNVSRDGREREGGASPSWEGLSFSSDDGLAKEGTERPVEEPDERREQTTRVVGERTASRERLEPHQEILASGETSATPEEEAQQLRETENVEQRGETEARGHRQRKAWWTLVVLAAFLWLFEIATFSSWWGFLGTFVAFILGLFLLPFFPVLALLQRDFDVMLASFVFVLAIIVLAAYTWTETLRVVRGGARRRK